MNLVTLNQPLTMSSREIAELTGKKHSHVKRDIDKMCAEINHPELEGSTFEHRGNWYAQYHLDKDLTLCLISGYNAKVRMAIIKRWMELEKESQPSWVAQISPQAMIAIQDLSNQLTAANNEVDRLQGVCQTITAQFATGMTAPAFCKQFNGVNTQQVNGTLIAMNMLRKSDKGLMPTSYARDKYFKYTNETVENTKTGYKAEKAITTLTLTGAKWLYRAYLSNKLPMKKTWDGRFSHVEFEVKEI